MSKRPAPEWLRSRWEQKKQETAARVQAAVDQLKRHRQDATLEGIRDAIRLMSGVSVSATTITRNELAYSIYLANRPKPRTTALPERALKQLVEKAAENERRNLQSKISRLRRQRKDALIAKLISQEQEIAKYSDVERRLRDEIVRLSPRP
jgi:hypothetical protein